MPATRLSCRHLFGISPLSVEELELILNTAKSFQKVHEQPLKKLATLRGKTVLLAFFEASTRTMTSFSLAAQRLGADVIPFLASGSSVAKGESLTDTLLTLEALKPDGVVLRHSASGSPEFVARHLRIPVINAGDGQHEHPTQALLDALTIRDHKGTLTGLKVTVVGDVQHSRVARSNVHLLSKFGSQVTLCGPPAWLPPYFGSLAPGVRLSHCLEEALTGADVVMALRVQTERRAGDFFPVGEYVREFQLTRGRLERAKPDAIVMHPGPMNRGLEIDSEVADGTQSVVLQQVTNGLAVRMALLFLLLGSNHSRPSSASSTPLPSAVLRAGRTEAAD
jgi:aspartate carbamoyltransferase catalytic subunit